MNNDYILTWLKLKVNANKIASLWFYAQYMVLNCKSCQILKKLLKGILIVFFRI